MEPLSVLAAHDAGTRVPRVVVRRGHTRGARARVDAAAPRMTLLAVAGVSARELAVAAPNAGKRLIRIFQLGATPHE